MVKKLLLIKQFQGLKRMDYLVADNFELKKGLAFEKKKYYSFLITF